MFDRAPSTVFPQRNQVGGKIVQKLGCDLEFTHPVLRRFARHSAKRIQDRPRWTAVITPLRIHVIQESNLRLECNGTPCENASEPRQPGPLAMDAQVLARPVEGLLRRLNAELSSCALRGNPHQEQGHSV